MRRTILPAVLALGLVATPAAPAARLKDRPGPAHYFPTTVGAKWVYQFAKADQTEVVTHVRREGGDVVVSVGYERPGGEVAPIHTMALRGDGLYMLDEVGKPYDPPVCVLKLPVKVGDRWEGTSSRPDLGKIRYAKEVREVRKLQTPAGAFQAVGVDSEFVVGAAENAPKDRYWYAPDIGLIQIEKVRALKSFTPGKD
jgi:hypothetical protein